MLLFQATSNKIDIPSRKIKEHDNDEGFEETQSLMSESPSQGASSGGNYETDIIDSSRIVVANYTKPKTMRALSVESKGTVDSTTSSETPTSISRNNRILSQHTKLANTPKSNTRPIERSASLRKTSQDNPALKRSTIPKDQKVCLKATQKQISNPNQWVFKNLILEIL